MNTCPNPNSPEWKELVAKLGEAQAMTAYTLNGNNTPSVEQAEALLSRLKIQEKDEQLSRSSDEFKLQRAVQQRTYLEQQRLKTFNPRQQATFDKLIAMNTAYQEFLKNNIILAKNGQPTIKTVSVSNFIGSSEFKDDTNPLEYEAFKLFGTFMHEVLELAQLRSIDQVLDIDKVLDEDFFKQTYDNFVKKNPFFIENLSEKDMFEMAKELAKTVVINNKKDFIILPEVTVMGTTRTGTKVLGRLDLMVIDKDGNVNILDFKTKKVKNLAYPIPGTDNVQINHDYAFLELASTSHQVSNKVGTAIAFGKQSRTPYDTWTLQLKVYENILMQSDIPIGKSSIVSLMYQTDENKKYMASDVHVFEGNNYYLYAATASIPDLDESWRTIDTRKADDIKQLRNIVDQEIPTSDVQEEEKTAKKAKSLEFEPSEESDEKLKDSLTKIVNDEIKNTYEQISNLKNADPEKKNERLQKILENRAKSLQSFKSILSAMNNTSAESVKYSKNLALAIEAALEDFGELAKLSDEAIQNFKVDKNSFTTKEGQQISQAYRKSKSLAVLLETIKEVVDDARSNPENNITVDSNIMKVISEMEAHKERIQSNFAKAGMYNSVKVLQTLGQQVFDEVSADVQEVAKERLKILEKQLQKLKEGKALSIAQTMKSSVLSFMSKEFKTKLAERMGPGSDALIYEIEQLEKQILTQQAIVDGGLNGSAESLERYINGITDSASDFYLGTTNAFNTSSWTQNLMMDRFIASASNSGIEIAAFTMMLKNAESRARFNAQNDLAALKFDQKRDSLLKKYTVEQLNGMVSEKRNYTTVDKDGKIIEKSELQMVTPFSSEYKDKYHSFSTRLRELNAEVETAKAEFNASIKTEEEAAKKQALTDKISERQNLRTEHIKWMMENCHLPYNEKFYQLQLNIPDEIRNQIQEKYLEMEVITFQVGKGNEVLLDENDFDRLEELEIEIQKLRASIKESNPQYAEQMAEFNDLFEFDVNQAYFDRVEFNARTKYETEFPEEWERWKKRNTVTKPTSEWYEEIAALYEARAELFGSDPIVGDLMQQRRNILQPYKVGGRIKPQYLSQVEIDQLSEIEARLEEIFESKSKSRFGLSQEEKKLSRELSDKLKQISSLQLSDSYNDTFERKVKSLFEHKNSIIAAESKLAEARSKGDKKAIEEAEEDLIFEETQFSTQEDEFSKWFNMHHENKYQSIIDGYDIRNNRVPRNYNYEKLPASSVREKYMETVPHPKYKIKRLKESSKNPNFLKSPDGIPMPKAIIKDSDGNYTIDPAYRNSPNINSKFVDLMNNDEVFSFYNDMTKFFFSLQSRVDGRKIGYMVPGYAASTIENIKGKGWSQAVKDEYSKFVDKHVRSVGSIDEVENTFGNHGAAIRHRYTEQLPEHLQTQDAIGAILKYATEVHYNAAMQEVAPQADMYIEHLQSIAEKLQKQVQQGASRVIKDKETGKEVTVDMSKRLAQLNNVIEILEFERKKFLYGQAETNKDINKKVLKRMNAVFAYTSMIRIGFDIVNQTKNYVSGNVQAFIAAGGMDSDKYTREDYMWAKGKVYGYNGFLHSYFGDWGKVSDVNVDTMLYRFYNPAQKDFIKYVSEVTGGKGRRFAGKTTNVQELGFMMQDKGDTEIAVTVMYAVMNHHKFRVIEKYDSEGNPVYQKDEQGNPVTVPVHQIYIKDKNGLLTRRKDVEFTDQDENRIRNTIYSEMRRAQGNYANADQTKFEENIVGKMVYFFRKYLVPQLLNRFGYMRANWEGSEAAMGYWRAVILAWRSFGPKEVGKHFLLGSKHVSKYSTNQMGNFMTRKVGQARRDAITMMIMTVLAMMARNYVRKKDDDDEELGMLEGNAIRVLWGVKGETLSLWPIGSGGDEYVRNFTTATTYLRELQNIKKFGSHAISYGIAMTMNGGEEPDPNYDSQFYQDAWKDAFYSRKYGGYEKGDAKIGKDIMDLTGLKNFRNTINPNYIIDQMKGKQ
jgi:hypothetical protein